MELVGEVHGDGVGVEQEDGEGVVVEQGDEGEVGVVGLERYSSVGRIPWI